MSDISDLLKNRPKPIGAICGVDAIFAIKKELMTEIIMRVGGVKYSYVRLFINKGHPLVRFCGKESQAAQGLSDGEVAIIFCGITLIMSVSINESGRMVFNIEAKEENPNEFMKPLYDFIKKLHYQLDHDILNYLPAIQKCGLKVNSPKNNTLLLGIEFKDTRENNWETFYNEFESQKAIRDNNQWGIFVHQQVVNAAIRKYANNALIDTMKSLFRYLDLTLTEIKIPIIRLVTVGTLQNLRNFKPYIELNVTGKCKKDSPAELIDFDVTFRVSFSVEGYDIYFNIGFDELIKRIKNIWDIEEMPNIKDGLNRFFDKLLESFLGIKDNTLQIELLSLIRPETGRLQPDDPLLDEFGIFFQGKGPGEENSSNLEFYTKALEKKIWDPLKNLRPLIPIEGTVIVANLGSSTAAIISAKFEGADTDPFTFIDGGRFRLNTKIPDWPPINILPGEQTDIQISFQPFSVQYEQIYRSKLIIDTIKKSFDSSGKVSYIEEKKELDITAKYIGLEDRQFCERIDPWDIYFDPFIDEPYRDFPKPYPRPDQEYLYPEFIEITTEDPLVTGMDVYNVNDELLIEVEAYQNLNYITFQLDKNESYNFTAKSGPGRILPPGYEANKKDVKRKTLVNLKRSFFIPEGKIITNIFINDFELLNRELFISARKHLWIYHIANPAKPIKLLSKTLKREIITFGINTSSRTKKGWPFLICVDGTGLFTLELITTSDGKLKLNPVKYGTLNLDINQPVKIEFYYSNGLVLGTDKLTLVDIHDPQQITCLSNFGTRDKANDMKLSGHLVFIGTEKGIEVVAVRYFKFLESIAFYKTNSPVKKLEIKEPFLYVTCINRETIVLEYSNPQSLKPVGRYKKPCWITNFIKKGDYFFTISEDRTKFEIFTPKTSMADNEESNSTAIKQDTGKESPTRK